MATASERFGVRKRVPADLADTLPNPGLPRGTHTASREHPDKLDADTPYASGDEKTPLQKVRRRAAHARRGADAVQHVTFWDRNKDGVIHIHETFAGFRALGFNFLCVPADAASASRLICASASRRSPRLRSTSCT
jgi:hypothetical protein